MIIGTTDAETCRINDWAVGTVLAGDEGYGVETIVITGIGEASILARGITDRHGQPVEESERHWTLEHGEWYEVKHRQSRPTASKARSN